MFMNPVLNRKQVKKNIARIFINKILNLIARNCIFNLGRIFLYRLQGMKIGRNVFIGMDCFIDDQLPHLIKIEDNVTISFRAILAVHGHHNKVSAIRIKRNAWIGTNAVILQGVNIGENSIIAAGAVVNKDVDDNTLVGGVPAKKIKNVNPAPKTNTKN